MKRDSLTFNGGVLKKNVLLLIIFLAGCGNSGRALDFYHSGMREFGARKLAEAEKSFISAIESDPGLMNAHLMLCKINYYNGDYGSALEYADTILNSDPDHANALYWKARSLLMCGNDNMGDPAALLVRSLEIDGHNIHARLLLGMVHERNSRYREALHQYMTVIEEEDGIISARGSLALLYRRMGFIEKYKEELSVAEKIAALSGKGIKRIKMIRSETDEVK